MGVGGVGRRSGRVVEGNDYHMEELGAFCSEKRKRKSYTSQDFLKEVQCLLKNIFQYVS